MLESVEMSFQIRGTKAWYQALATRAQEGREASATWTAMCERISGSWRGWVGMMQRGGRKDEREMIKRGA
jgi:hypothetical protein